MRRRPNSPFTFLQDFNKKAQEQDGKYKVPYPMYWSLSYQQFTPFKIPPRFEELHKNRKHEQNIEVAQKYERQV